MANADFLVVSSFGTWIYTACLHQAQHTSAVMSTAQSTQLYLARIAYRIAHTAEHAHVLHLLLANIASIGHTLSTDSKLIQSLQTMRQPTKAFLARRPNHTTQQRQTAVACLPSLTCWLLVLKLSRQPCPYWLKNSCSG